jgi:hypothetical protein
MQCVAVVIHRVAVFVWHFVLILPSQPIDENAAMDRVVDDAAVSTNRLNTHTIMPI